MTQSIREDVMKSITKFATTTLCCFAGTWGLVENSHADAGGRLMPEQAAYDVRHYDLDLKVDVEKKFPPPPASGPCRSA